MREFPAASLSPSRVHDRARALSGHHPCWIRRPYAGGIYSIAHFRICSYCECAHPGDAIDLLLAGESRLEDSPKPSKHYLITPNPIAGDLVAMGSSPGAVFDRAHWPADLRHRLKDPARPGLAFRPSIGERLAGHFERPALEQAPAWIQWPLYSEHISQSQWPEIWAAARGEKEHVPSLSNA
jgi:hypothetical protein